MPKEVKIIFCEEQQLRLIPLRYDLHFRYAAKLSYCKGHIYKKKQKNKRKKAVQETQEVCSCTPIFNKDKSYVTGSFILPEEINDVVGNSEKLKLEHDREVEECGRENSEIYIPKPRNSSCATCNVPYDDYLIHALSPEHKGEIRKAKFTTYINELEKRYESLHPKKIHEN